MDVNKSGKCHENIKKKKKSASPKISSKKEEKEIMNFGDRLSEAFASKEFLSALKSTSEHGKEFLLQSVLVHFILTPDGLELKPFLDECLEIIKTKEVRDEQYFHNLIVNIIKKKLQLPDITSPASNDAIFKYFVEHFHKKGYVFHAFNGAFLKAIQENGLSPKERLWNWDEVVEIHEMFDRAGETPIFGSLFTNCYGLLSYDETPKNVYSYASCSPEWFSIFAGTNLREEDNFDAYRAFEKRDYDLAKNNVLATAEYLTSEAISKKGFQPITLEEKIKLLTFFEKYWSLFTSEGEVIYLALIKISSLNPPLNIDPNFSLYKSYRKCDVKDLSVEEKISLFFLELGINSQTEQSFRREDLEFAKLPPYTVMTKEPEDDDSYDFSDWKNV